MKPNLRFFIDAKAVAEEFGNLKNQVEDAVTEGVKQVASMTHAKVIELANEKLKSTRQTYLDALDFTELQPGLWVVSLAESAMWIEEDVPPYDMTKTHLKKNYKISKDGHKYKHIPFSYSKSPSQTPISARMFVDQVKSELRTRNIPYKKLEYDANGSPKIGRLHTIKDIKSLKPSARASHGALSGLTIYQRMGKSGKVQRDVVTFRTMSSKHSGSKWMYPGSDGKKLMDKALEWGMQVFDNEIIPTIMERFGK